MSIDDDIYEITNSQFSTIANISAAVSGEEVVGISQASTYTKVNDVMESLFFRSLEVPRFVDLERDLMLYEHKFVLKSSDFYNNWKTKAMYDNLEFNKWAQIYQLLNYVRQV